LYFPNLFKYYLQFTFFITVGIASISQREQVIRDIMRFPSMLAAPPDRILGWRSLMQAHGVASKPVGRFGRFMRKAPFMYYVNPPQLFDLHVTNCGNKATDSNHSNQTVTTASGFVAYESLSVLSYLQEVLNDNSHMDKVVRTQPTILLTSVHELKQRVMFLRELLHRVTAENSKRSKQLEADKTNFDEFVEYVEASPVTQVQGFELISSLPSVSSTAANKRQFVDDILEDSYSMKSDSNRGVYKMVTSLPSVATQSKQQQKYSSSISQTQSNNKGRKSDPIISSRYSTSLRPSSQVDIQRVAEQKALLALVLAYPAILSVESRYLF